MVIALTKMIVENDFEEPSPRAPRNSFVLSLARVCVGTKLHVSVFRVTRSVFLSSLPTRNTGLTLPRPSSNPPRVKTPVNVLLPESTFPTTAHLTSMISSALEGLIRIIHEP